MRETSDILDYEKIRLSRVASVIAVCGMAWLSFGIYYLVSGRMPSGCHCVFQGILASLFAFSSHYQPRLRTRLASWWCVLIVVGLTVEASLVGVELAISPMFYSCAVLVAALTLGRRAAIGTTIASIVAILVINLVLPGILPITAPPHALDHPLAYLTLLGVICTCLLFAEATAETFAARLASTTDDLLKRTEELNQIVGIDALTSLANRRRFREDAIAMVESANGDEGFVLILLDLNGFKQVNDRFGHSVGDKALCFFANGLRDKFRNLGNVYRMGGNEFIALVPGKRGATAKLLARAEKRLSKISLDFMDKTASAGLSFSCGASVFPEHASTVDELVSNADNALCEAKATPNEMVVFDATMAEKIERHRQLMDDLNAAVDNEDFELNYQPLVDVSSNEIAGAEALIRWKRHGKPVSPLEFIPHLEANERIVEVGVWVLRTACGQLAKWRIELGTDMQISVNVSVVQIQCFNFAEVVLGILDEFALPGSALDLEVTESLLIDQGDIVRQNIEKLVAHEVRFSIDDFGTGFSSLSYLKTLTVDRLKIDRSFIKDIPETDDGSIAETIITLARYLNMTVVAEGVELPSQLAFLKEQGCDKYQGYLFGKPVSAAAFTEILSNETKTAGVDVKAFSGLME